VWGGKNEFDPHFTRIKIISGAYSESGSRVDFLYRNVKPEMITSKVEETSKKPSCMSLSKDTKPDFI
jgi:hypothetical protein